MEEVEGKMRLFGISTIITILAALSGCCVVVCLGGVLDGFVDREILTEDQYHWALAGSAFLLFFIMLCFLDIWAVIYWYAETKKNRSG